MIQRSALGADFGALASFAKLPNAYFGVAVRNAVEPNMTFVRTGPDADFPLRRDLRPFKRQIGVGAAYVGKRYLAALDVVDIGDHAGAQAVRVGAEYSINKLFAVRAGYDTLSKFTVGVSIGGLNAALNRERHDLHRPADPVLKRWSLPLGEGRVGSGKGLQPSLRLEILEHDLRRPVLTLRPELHRDLLARASSS